MRAPPAVHVDADGGAGWRVVRAALAAAATGVPLAWAAPWVSASHARLSTTLAGLAAAMMGALRWQRLARRESTHASLRWDGATWSVCPAPGAPPVTGAATLVLDLGGWMLVRFRATGSPPGPGASIWLPVRASADPSRWRALRAALWTWRAEPRPEVR